MFAGAADFKLIPSIWRKLDRRRGGRIKLLVLTCRDSCDTDSYTSWLKSVVKGDSSSRPHVTTEIFLFPILISVPTRENVQFVGDGSSHSDGHLAFVHRHCELANTTSWQSVILSKSSPHFWPGGKMYKRSQMKERTNSMYPPQKSKNISNNDPASDKVSRWDCPGATAVRWPTVRLGLMPTCPLSLHPHVRKHTLIF